LLPIARRAARFAFSGRSLFAEPGSVDGGFDEFDEFRLRSGFSGKFL